MSQLSLYNEALRLCGERILANLSENVEARRLLDSVWDDDFVSRCLEMGQWQFATRAAALDYSPSVEPSFGWQYAFDKPTDFIRTAAVCTDPYFRSPLLDYTEEAGFWFADNQTIYVKYISNDSQYGGDMSLWPTSFTRFAAAYLADEIVHRISQDKERWALIRREKKERLLEAKSNDALAEPTKFTPPGTWVRSRRGRSNSDNGNTGSLIG